MSDYAFLVLSATFLSLKQSAELVSRTVLLCWSNPVHINNKFAVYTLLKIVPVDYLIYVMYKEQYANICPIHANTPEMCRYSLCHEFLATETKPESRH